MTIDFYSKRSPDLFLGREQDLALISQYLSDPQCRLLTLVGLGGIGKTRLMLKYCETLTDMFTDGVHIVYLANMTDVDQIIPAIGKIVRCPFQPSQNYQTQLFEYLRTQNILIAFDNFEHLLVAAPLIADLLNSTHSLKVLVASRTRLNLSTEWVHEVQGLDYPHRTSDATMRLQDYSSIQLFIQHIRRVYPQVDVSASDLTTIAQICQIAEGMPLAIQLAANWIRVIPLNQILEQMTQTSDIMSHGSQDFPSRHTSLRNVFDYSWLLLSEYLQQVLSRLSIFPGKFDAELAETITGANIADLIALVDYSMIERDGTGSFHVHKLMQQFAREKLEDSQFLVYQIHNQHSEYFADLLHSIEHRHRTIGLGDEIECINKNYENIGQGWKWSIDQHDLDKIIRYSYSLSYYYYVQGMQESSIHEYENTLKTLQNMPSSSKRDYAMGRIRSYYAETLSFNGLYNEANQLFEESYELLQSQSELPHFDLGMTLMFYGRSLCKQRNYDQGKNKLLKASALFNEIKAPFGQWLVPGILAEAAYIEGNYHQSIKYAKQALDTSSGFDNISLTSLNHAYLGINYAKLGEVTRSIAHLQSVMRVNPHIFPLPYFLTIESIAFLLEINGDFTEAFRLLHYILNHPFSSEQHKSRVTVHLQTLEDKVQYGMQLQINDEMRQIRNQISVENYCHMFTLDDLHRLLMKIKTTLKRNYLVLLTRREQQILQFISKGWSNQDICDELTVSMGTVKRHTHNIFNKLGVRNRTQAVLRASEMDLV